MTEKMPRRDFLAAALAAGLATKLPAENATRASHDAATSGSAAALPAGQRLRWGIIGTGSRAMHHIDAIRSFPHMEIVALCDVDATRLQQGIKRTAASPLTTPDYRKLLAMDDIDAVLICTPNLLHSEMVLAALEADKHVACEKPMATTLAECEKMQLAASESKKTVIYTMQLRYANRYAELRRYIDAGHIGIPRFFWLSEFRGDWNNRVWQYTDPATGKTMNWRHSHRATGGTLNEKCCHYFDILHWMAGGPPDSVSCSGGVNYYKDNRDTWDHALVTMEFANDAKAELGLCMYAPHRLELQIIGDKGTLLLPPSEDFVILQRGKSKEQQKLPLTPEIGHGERGAKKGIETAMLRMYEDFEKCIATGAEPLTNSDLALASCKTAFRAEDAEREKRTVKWAD